MNIADQSSRFPLPSVSAAGMLALAFWSLLAITALIGPPAQAQAPARKPNISSSWATMSAGRPGETVTTDMPTITNIRQDPFERTSSIRGETRNNIGGGDMNNFMAREFWHFVVVQQTVAKAPQSAIEYPPMQAPATFNLDAVKAQVEEMMKAHEGQ
jgi:hypothetical protein